MMLLSAHYDCWRWGKELKEHAVVELKWDLSKSYTIQSVERLEHVQDVFGLYSCCNAILDQCNIPSEHICSNYDYHINSIKDFHIQCLNVCDLVSLATDAGAVHYPGLSTQRVGKSSIMSVRWTCLVQEGQVVYLEYDPWDGAEK